MPPRKAAATPKAKAPARKVAAKPAPVADKSKTLKALQERYTKTDIFNRISEVTELNRKDVAAVFAELENIIEAHIKKRAVGEFTLPGLMKIVTVKKPAVKARKGINPFTGEETTFKAKPASVAVKIRPLKKLKEFAM